MTYKEALDYLFSQLPMFHRIGAPAYKANLNNTVELSRVTGFAHNEFRSIHIAGTNGKGSVSHMMASIFQEAGLKTGLFTSPHLIDFRERMKINGKMIPENYVISFIESHKEDFTRIKPSFFEMTFVMAMCWFRDSDIDIAVIETGLGGRLDSTNVITPELSVITNIGYDHMQFLGDTLELIATEKAGIIKPGIPVIIGESNTETDKVFIDKAAECTSKLIFADKAFNAVALPLIDPAERVFQVTDIRTGYTLKVISPLTGDYQIKNIITALSSTLLCQPLRFKNTILNESTVLNGIRKTIENTGLEGRWQILQKEPLTICDIGHNTHSLPLIVNQINQITYRQLHFVLGVVNDKDIRGMLSLLPENAIYYFCKADIPRGLDAVELQKHANACGLKGDSYSSVQDAFKAAEKKAEKEDLIFIGGSAFVVAEVLPLFNHR